MPTRRANAIAALSRLGLQIDCMVVRPGPMRRAISTKRRGGNAIPVPGTSHEAVLVASEPLTDERGWSVVPPQHLLSISPDHRIETIPLGDAEIRTAMEGALCRCMTYYRVQAAIKRAARGTKAAAGDAK